MQWHTYWHTAPRHRSHPHQIRLPGAERETVTSEVAGSSPVHPANLQVVSVTLVVSGVSLRVSLSRRMKCWQSATSPRILSQILSTFS